MAVIDLIDWMNDFTKPNIVWYVKRLSANDTLANCTHQAGPYIPKKFLFDIFPSLNRPEEENPSVWFDLIIDSHPDVRQVRAIWYNNKVRGTGTRNEARVTNFGGGTSALLDPESTGALTIFAFEIGEDLIATNCHVWVCRHETEEELVEDRIGPIEPGTWKIWSIGEEEKRITSEPPICRDTVCCRLTKEQIPPEWLIRFPCGAEIINKVISLRPLESQKPDVKIMKRRECEFEVFQSIEEFIELQRITNGFNSLEEFINCAQTILQRRKARSGRSLELHTRAIFIEEGLIENIDFSHQPESEKGKKPDFLFPAQESYKDKNFPSSKLRMLAVKTTCKDRWRQILNEADRIPQKHLFTLQEGISENQHKEMKEAGVKLVVPEGLIKAYPSVVQPELQTLESFIADVRVLNL